MSSDISKLATPNSGRTPAKTKSSNPGAEGFIEFGANNIYELSDEVYKKHNLSDPFNGLILACEQISRTELVERTSPEFVSGLSKSGEVFYEYYVHVSGLSEYTNFLTASILEVYLKLKAEAATLSTTKLKDIKDNTHLKALKEAFPTNKDINDFINAADGRVKSYHRFYSAAKKINGVLVACKIKFHDRGNLEYGITEEIRQPVNYATDVSFKQRISSAKKQLKLSNASKNKLQATKTKLDPDSKKTLGSIA